MERLTRVLSAAFVGIAGCLLSGPAAAQGTRAPEVAGMQARVTNGSVTGTVSDDRGGVLGGAMVSAIGATLASTVTDDGGRFTFQQLPAGDYVLRAHMRGFAASSSLRVRVGGTPTVHRLELRRLDAVVATTGTAARPVEARPIIAAGFDLPRGTSAEAESDAGTDADHPHNETSWRLRHIKRSILKDSASIVVVTEDAELPSGSLFGRAVESAASLATSIFTHLPFSGEVNFLTTGAVAQGGVLSATALPRGVAYLALAAPAPGGDWSIRAAMSEGDVSSWIIAGAFASKAGRRHSYDFGLTYSAQEYLGGNPAALAAVSEGNRNVGEVYAFDRWKVAKAVTLEYGGRYAHYDYLEDPGLLSPRLGFSIEGTDGRVRASIEQRMVAPGAEEFLSTNAPGPWLPPERTFAPLGDPSASGSFRVERARSWDVALERDLGETVVIGVGRFHQSVDDQLATLFGAQSAAPRSAGHYYVGTVGSFEADGWMFSLDTNPERRVHGSLTYSLARANWTGRGDVAALLPAAAIRPDTEDLHDFTGSIRANIPETATRVILIYKLNTGYARSIGDVDRSGLDGRYDFQVNQALPVGFAGTRWEVLVGVRNFFRDPTDPASVYDELLVVRPPKRLVGGVLVRF